MLWFSNRSRWSINSSDVRGERVQAAFFFVCPRPTARTFAYAVGHRARAAIGRATDTRVAVIVERVVGKLMAHDVPPDFLFAPRGERIDFDIPVTVRRFLHLQNLRALPA